MLPLSFDDKYLSIIVIAAMGIVCAWMAKTSDGINVAIGAIAGMAIGRPK